MNKTVTLAIAAFFFATPVAYAQSTKTTPQAFVSTSKELPGNNKNKDKACTGAVSTVSGGGSCGISKN